MIRYLNTSFIFKILCLNLVTIVGVLVAFSSDTSAADRPYKDVPDNVYFSTPVEVLNRAGVFEGTTCADDMFCPSQSLKRWQMAVWMVRVLEEEPPPPITESRFADIEPSVWYAPYVERLYQLDITTGCSDGTIFCPDREVTRSQMAAFITRSFDLPESPPARFEDVPVGAWYASYVAALLEARITVGCEDGTKFCPDTPTSNAHMATFLHRAIEYETIPTGDCSRWYPTTSVGSSVFLSRTETQTGTAFYIGNDLWIGTAHALAGTKSVTLHKGATVLQASILTIDEDADVALLRANSEGILPLVLTRDETFSVDLPIYVVGYPLEPRAEPTITQGTTYDLVEYTDRVSLTLNATVVPGNSGSPVG